MMDPYFAIIAGLIQGLTEWLPISSTGQGMLALMNLFRLTPEQAFSFALALHLGTLFSVLVRMRAEVKDLVLRLPDFRRDRLVQFILVSTLFTGLIGAPLYVFLKENFSAWHGDLATAFVGLLLMATGAVLYFSRKLSHGKKAGDLSFFEMVLAGVAQGVAVLPGISRSGLTVAALLFRGVRQEDALRLSFLMSIPAILGALVLEMLDGSAQSFGVEALAGIFSAFAAGYLAMDILLKAAKKIRFDLFCMAFGLIAVVFYLFTVML